MAKFDWNEIIVTNDGDVVNEQVAERMILVTGEKGDTGKDGRGILQIKKTSSTASYDVYTVTYTDGTKSTFSIALPTAENINNLEYYFYVDKDNGNDENDGAPESPFKTLLRAIEAIPFEKSGHISIESEGDYGGITIENKSIILHITKSDTELQRITLDKANLSIIPEVELFTTGHIEAKESTINVYNSSQSQYPHILIKTSEATGISLDNSQFTNNYRTLFEITNESSRYGIDANNSSVVYLDDVVFTGVVTTALTATRNSIISYISMSGDDSILHREVVNTSGCIYHNTPYKSHIYFVDGENGRNYNVGTRNSSPFQTLQQAVDLIPNNFHSTITLLNGNCGNATIENKDITINLL